MPERAPLLSLEHALAQLIAAGEAARIQERVTLATLDAAGRVLAQPVLSTIDVPGADNSAMDGYALRAADLAGGATVPVHQRIAAGSAPQPLAPGCAARIFTGALVPPGADTVVPQEDAEAVAGEGLGGVRVAQALRVGQHIRRRGEDVEQGAQVLAAGTRLTPQALGLAAAVGAAQLTVVRRPRVALLCTGDELVMPGQPLRPGEIYNSNRFTLRALLDMAGCETRDLGTVPDDLAATRSALTDAARGCDLIISAGGVSVGEEDHLKPALESLGRLALWQVAIKPGKPLALGAVRRDDGSEALYLGLPGNPVSAFITFVLAVRPLLQALQGLDTSPPRTESRRADFDWPRPDRRREFLRVRGQADGSLALFPNQSSGVLTSLVWGDGLIDNPPGQVIRSGDQVRFLSWSECLNP